jgi:hypothetical protein
MVRAASAIRLLGLLRPHWHELPQRWALDGSISSSAQDSLHKDGQPPLLAEPAIRTIAGPFAPDHTTCWPADSARHVCSRSWDGDREHGLV